MKRKTKKRILLYVIAAILVVCGIFAYQTNKRSAEKKAQKEAMKNQIKTIDDLDGKKIGVQIGTTGDIYASDYEGDKAGTVVERYNKGADAVQALKLGKINCVIIDEQPAKAYVEKNKELKILQEDFADEEYALCINKTNTDLKEKINAALQKLKEDGTLDQIMKNFIGKEDEKGKYPYKKKNVKRTGTLTVATNAEFPPYEYFENGKICGLDADMMQAVCDEIGMNLKIQNMDFDSIITAVKSGKADVGAAGMTVTEDRLKNIDFSDTYAHAKQVVIVKGSATVSETRSFKEAFHDNFIKEHRYQYLVKGFGNTILITFFAIIIGILFGLVIAVIRVSHDRNGSVPLLNLLCKVYLTVMRGTPAVVQLLIIYYVILTSVQNKIIVAIVAFGLNSAAYVAEVIRSGIMSVDAGQMEAGRSLGLSYHQAMLSVIVPQAIKNVLPALGNEFIVLIKETSISGYIGLMDLTRGGDIIRSITYEAYLPLYAVALVYLVTVMILSAGVGLLERKLREKD